MKTGAHEFDSGRPFFKISLIETNHGLQASTTSEEFQGITTPE